MGNTDIDTMKLDALASFNNTFMILSALLLLTAAFLDNNHESPRRRRCQRRNTEYQRFQFDRDNLSN